MKTVGRELDAMAYLFLLFEIGRREKCYTIRIKSAELKQISLSFPL